MTNLLLVLSDQFRASSIGCLGEDPTITPALDTLAGEGLLLTAATSTYPVCSPARAMLLTGRNPWANGVPFNVNSETAPWGVGLRPDAVCWSDVLEEAGYALGYIGKWHLTPPTDADELYGEGRRDDGKVWDAWTPPEQRHGFSFWYSHGCNDHHLEPHYWDSDTPREGPHRVHQWSAAHETDVAIEFLRGVPAGRPFALMVSVNPPHQPFDQVPDGYRDRYAALSPAELLRRPNVDLDSDTGREAAGIAKNYFAAVSAVDDQIARLMAELEQLGLADDTVVVFTSDHGMQLGSHGLMYKNVPYEESMRVPFLVRWPGHVPHGRDDLLLSSLDVSPTVLGLLGLADRIPEGTEGLDCSGALLGKAGAARPDAALYLGPARLLGHQDVRGLRTHGYKLVARYHEASGLSTELYDLRRDPYELVDIAAAVPGFVEGMLGDLARRLERAGDPWPGLAHLTRR